MMQEDAADDNGLRKARCLGQFARCFSRDSLFL